MKRNRNKGFSLVELLIAIAILAIIMVMMSSLLSSTLHEQRKTKKAMQMQTEAQRIYYQLSEALMQATYVRVESLDGKLYDSEGKPESKTLLSKNLVPDNYPNYQLGGETKERPVRVDLDTGEIFAGKNKKYPLAGREIDKADADVVSFWVLTKKIDDLEGTYRDYYYVKPKYIYIEYSSDKLRKSYVIFAYDEGKNELRMYRPDSDFAQADVPGASANFAVAKGNLSASEGLVTSYVQKDSFYLTANPAENYVKISMKIEDSKYKGCGYQLNETVNIRNTNVLSVKPLNLKDAPDDSTETP